MEAPNTGLAGIHFSAVSGEDSIATTSWHEPTQELDSFDELCRTLLIGRTEQ